MTLNDWYSFFQVGSLIMLFLTFAFGAGAILTGLKVNKGATRQILKLEARIAESTEETERIKAAAAKDKDESAKRIAELNRDTVGLSADVANANARAAEANRIAESEQLARLQLEARLAPRVLTADQQERLISLLKPFFGTQIDAVTFGDTPEIGNISMTILSCLRKAGWNVNSGSAGGGALVVAGILVGVRANSDATTNNAARALFVGLQSMGIGAGPWDFDKMPSPGILFNSSVTFQAAIRVYIGSKP
jgi:hypothetical protein